MYLALYRKYRPKTFDDVVSQPHITTTLTNQIKTGSTAHAYLFTGSRGTGKTTCAKILAMALNCLNPHDGSPCLECANCREIENGTPDVVEMDAASNNGVDDVRALRDEVAYTPVSCKKRVYIIDEVHMLSTAAFNALLKTLEEPPPHVVFILATTESHKVPATILSRCQRFEFRRIDTEDSAARLMHVAELENIKLDKNAALFISRLSDGGMRDALSILDQCIGISENVTVDVVRESAGVAGREHLFALADCVKKSDTASALKILDELHRGSKDIGRLIEELIGHFRNLMLLKVMPDDTSLVTALPDELDMFKSQNREFSMSEIMRTLSLLQECGESLSKTKQRKTLAEMYLIKLCNPNTDSSLATLAQRLDRLESAVCGGAPIDVPPYAPKVRTQSRDNPPEPAKRPVNSAVSGMLDKIHELANARSGDEKPQTVISATAPTEDKSAPSAVNNPQRTEENSESSEQLPFDLDEDDNTQTADSAENSDDNGTETPVFITSENLPEAETQTESADEEVLDGQVGFDFPFAEDKPESVSDSNKPKTAPETETKEKPEPTAVESIKTANAETAVSKEQISDTVNTAKPIETPSADDFYSVPPPSEKSVPAAPDDFVPPPFDDYAPPPEREELPPPEFSPQGLRARLPDAPPAKQPVINKKVEFAQSDYTPDERHLVARWDEIAANAPAAIGSLLDGSKAYFHESFIHVYPENSMLESFMKIGTNKERLEDTAEEILGKRYKIVVVPPKITNVRESSAVDKLFARARELGINVKIIEK